MRTMPHVRSHNTPAHQMIREWCGCGAAFHSHSIRRVREWRHGHYHDGKPDPEPEKQGTTAQVEMAYRDTARDDSERRIPDINARMGFNPNE